MCPIMEHKNCNAIEATNYASQAATSHSQQLTSIDNFFLLNLQVRSLKNESILRNEDQLVNDL